MNDIDFEFKYKEPIDINFIVEDEKGNPIDISNNGISLMIKSNMYDTDDLAKVDVTFTAPANQDSQNGIFNLIVTMGRSPLDVGVYYYEIDYIVNGVSLVIRQGKLEIQDRVRKQV